eukprot:g6744.t1
MGTGIEEAKQDLAELEDTLQTVHELLRDDPKNEEYLQMQKDASEGIEITKALIAGLAEKHGHAENFDGAKEAGETHKNVTEAESNSADNQTNVCEEQNGESSVEEVAPRVGQEKQGSFEECNVEKDTTQKQNAEQTNVNTIPKIKKSRWGSGIVPSIPQFNPQSLEYKCGDKVEVSVDFEDSSALWYPAIVEGWDNTCDSYDIFVLYDLSFKKIPKSKLRNLRLLNHEIGWNNLSPGTQVSAFYVKDDASYQAEILGVPNLQRFGISTNTLEALNGELYEIKYRDYGNTEVLPIEYLRPGKKTGKNVFSTVSADLPMDESALEKIPGHLVIKQTDTEEQKKRKRKKIKSIKSRNRFIKKDIQSNKRQASWQNFQSQMKNRSSFGNSRKKRKW